MLTIEFYLLSKPVTPVEDGADVLCPTSIKDFYDIFFIENVIRLKAYTKNPTAINYRSGIRGNSDAVQK